MGGTSAILDITIKKIANNILSSLTIDNFRDI
jgi:hypothetical protein